MNDLKSNDFLDNYSMKSKREQMDGELMVIRRFVSNYTRDLKYVLVYIPFIQVKNDQKIFVLSQVYGIVMSIVLLDRNAIKVFGFQKLAIVVEFNLLLKNDICLELLSNSKKFFPVANLPFIPFIYSQILRIDSSFYIKKNSEMYLLWIYFDGFKLLQIKLILPVMMRI